MSDLTEFLLARIAEDEAVATALRDQWRRMSVVSSGPGTQTAFWVQLGPARVLAECEAKRRLVRWCGQWGEPAFREPLAFLAAPYADHPDYNKEWKP